MFSKLESKNIIIYTCSACHSDLLRTTRWKKEKIHCVTTPFPLEAFRLETLSPDGCNSCQNWDDRGYILIKIDDRLRQNQNLLDQEIGQGITYLGSETKEKVLSPQAVRIHNSTALLRRAVSLLRVNYWFVPTESPLGDMLWRLVNSMTDIDPKIFETPSTNKTCSADHRYKDKTTKHGGYNMVKYNISTYLLIVTTTLTEYADRRYKDKSCKHRRQRSLWQ